MLFLTCLLFLSAYRTTATVSTVNDTISTTMILLYKSNVLTIYHGDDSNDLIMNCHKSLSCNNFPTVPSRPYLNYYCTIYMHVYYMLYVCVVLSIIKTTSVFCMYGLDLYQTSTGPDRFPCSALFHHMACSLFIVVTSVDQVVSLLLLGQCMLLLTPRNSMSFQNWYYDVNISCL